jgi:hypothetical protein
MISPYIQCSLHKISKRLCINLRSFPSEYKCLINFYSLQAAVKIHVVSIYNGSIILVSENEASRSIVKILY